MCCDSFFGVSHVPVLNSTLFITYTIDMRYKIYKCDNVSYADGNARVSMEQVTETPKLSTCHAFKWFRENCTKTVADKCNLLRQF